MLRYFFLILISLSILNNPVQPAFFMNIDGGECEKIKKEESNSRANGIFRRRMRESQSYLAEKGKKNFRSLKEAEGYLRCLLKERGVFEGDFFGVNITAYRYVNIFDRLRYIHYRIMEIDKKIKRTKLEISELKNEKSKS